MTTVTGRGTTDDAALSVSWRQVHPLGWVSLAALVAALAFHSLFETSYLIGNLAWWQWLTLVATVGAAASPSAMHRVRLALEIVPTATRQLAWVLAWVIFVVQLFNVITRYGNDLLDRDILIGQASSAAWQAFGLLFLLGANYGIRDGVNPRIDFWWAQFRPKTKAALDFVLHAALLLPFVWMSARILRGYAGTSLGQKRSGEWPSGWRVWETWEQSADADQLPVGPIKAMMFVGFVLIGLQVVAELIKTGFVLIGRSDLGDIAEQDAPLRVE